MVLAAFIGLVIILFYSFKCKKSLILNEAGLLPTSFDVKCYDVVYKLS